MTPCLRLVPAGTESTFRVGQGAPVSCFHGASYLFASVRKNASSHEAEFPLASLYNIAGYKHGYKRSVLSPVSLHSRLFCCVGVFLSRRKDNNTVIIWTCDVLDPRDTKRDEGTESHERNRLISWKSRDHFTFKSVQGPNGTASTPP